MFQYILRKIFGTQNDRDLKACQIILEEVNTLETTISKLSDEELKEKTPYFKTLLKEGKTLEDILPETFAVVREVAKRTLGERPYDVQIIGGIILHRGRIAEMKTGEGKTLVATLPVYLNALEEKGVHVVTVNDYLAKRDAEWMGAIYKFLGLSVGIIVHEIEDEDRKDAYKADVTYGTNNEFGFDYLRDNMKMDIEDYVQRKLNYCIVDEVDSILVDEARTPLIISGPTNETTDKYYRINTIIPNLRKGRDFVLDEKARTSSLTEDGVVHVEKLLGMSNLYDPSNIEIVHHVNQALKAHSLFRRDVDYVVKDNEVIIVDEFTGRLMPGRRYSDGLHQALEAKEHVNVANENQTLASITFQNYFRMYNKLAGMTGTAETESEEFLKIYKLVVNVIPTNEKVIRDDKNDVIYRTEREKFDAVATDVKELNKKGRPVLIGTISIDNSEKLSKLLKRQGVRHHVLNAKYHEKEAEIIAKAGQSGAVTIATNMAGRGTDIKLGEGVPGFGGLAIMGTERHESRRIDNQLRGRSGRQGDPGSTRFYVSLEDSLMRIFGSERISRIMVTLGMKEGEAIEHKFITRAIENAQKKVEGHNFDIRQQVLKYDDVMNKQRDVIYSLRRAVLEVEDLGPMIKEMMHEITEEIVEAVTYGSDKVADWDLEEYTNLVKTQFNFAPEIDLNEKGKEKKEVLSELIEKNANEIYDNKRKEMSPDVLRYFERMFLLQEIDIRWKEHLLNMDHLREGIGLRGYAQKDPLLEYKREGFELFMMMDSIIKENAIKKLMTVQLVREDQVEELTKKKEKSQSLSYSSPSSGGAEGKGEAVKREGKKVGRNDPCPCGSGKKYKKCCLNR